MHEKIKNFKIKLINKNIDKDYLIWDVDKKNKKQIIKYLKDKKVPFLQKMGFIVISKIYLNVCKTSFFYVNQNINTDDYNSSSLEKVVAAFDQLTVNIEDNVLCIEFKNNNKKLNISVVYLLNKIEDFYNKKIGNIDLDIKNNKLTILFLDDYNREIESYEVSTEDELNKIFSLFYFEEVKLSKLINKRIIEQVKSHYLDGFSINLEDYSIEIRKYSPHSDELCVLLQNQSSGKNIIIYPITFDNNTGLLLRAGDDIGQLRLI